MLLELRVTNFAVIDAMQVNFLRPGLNILTGETGAGKSILIKSLSFLLGGKATPEVIRTGQEQAVIEGAFDLNERPDISQELSDLALGSGDNSLVVRRILSTTGKHRLYINGHLSTVNVLEKIVPKLVEITGQHEHHSLIKSSSQLSVLDEFAGLKDLKKKFSEKFYESKNLKEEILALAALSRDREQKMDFLKFQIGEIENFNPELGEDEALVTKHQRARFATKLHNYAQKSELILYSGEASVSSQLGDLLREGEALLEFDPKLKTLVSSLKECLTLSDDAAFGFREYLKDVGGPDEQELDHLEERLSLLKKLQKKYGGSVEEIIRFKNSAKAEIESLEKNDENLKSLNERLSDLTDELVRLAGSLSEKRKKASIKLSAGVNRELSDLNMKGTELLVNVNKTEVINSFGLDEVAFLIKSAANDEYRPISKVASGGELSRLMLAIKQVISISDKPMTYLFDEVDTGVSGPTAQKVGAKLKSIGTAHQVICITHLPQVAAFADAHFLISKEVSKGHVKSEIAELNPKNRIQEIGRMISGEKITSASLTHARSMVEESKKYNARLNNSARP
jgi:DNA repair protein RecN (Recombination protein N)